MLTKSDPVVDSQKPLKKKSSFIPFWPDKELFGMHYVSLPPKALTFNSSVVQPEKRFDPMASVVNPITMSVPIVSISKNPVNIKPALVEYPPANPKLMDLDNRCENQVTSEITSSLATEKLVAIAPKEATLVLENLDFLLQKHWDELCFAIEMECSFQEDPVIKASTMKQLKVIKERMAVCNKNPTFTGGLYFPKKTVILPLETIQKQVPTRLLDKFLTCFKALENNNIEQSVFKAFTTDLRKNATEDLYRIAVKHGWIWLAMELKPQTLAASSVKECSLLQAVESNRIDLLALLLKNNTAPINNINELMQAAAARGLVDILLYLLEETEECINPAFCAPHAAKYGHIEAISILLDDQRVNRQEYYYSIMQSAIDNNQSDLALYLLNDPRVMHHDFSYENLFVTALSKGLQNLATQLLLTKKGLHHHQIKKLLEAPDQEQNKQLFEKMRAPISAYCYPEKVKNIDWFTALSSKYIKEVLQESKEICNKVLSNTALEKSLFVLANIEKALHTCNEQPVERYLFFPNIEVLKSFESLWCQLSAYPAAQATNAVKKLGLLVDTAILFTQGGNSLELFLREKRNTTKDYGKDYYSFACANGWLELAALLDPALYNETKFIKQDIVQSAAKGELDAVAYWLFAKNADPVKALQKAVINEQIPCINLLLQSKKITAADYEQAMTTAISYRAPDAVYCLLKDSRVNDKLRSKALLFAIEINHTKLLDLLSQDAQLLMAGKEQSFKKSLRIALYGHHYGTDELIRLIKTTNMDPREIYDFLKHLAERLQYQQFINAANNLAARLQLDTTALKTTLFQGNPRLDFNCLTNNFWHQIQTAISDSPLSAEERRRFSQLNATLIKFNSLDAKWLFFPTNQFRQQLEQFYCDNADQSNESSLSKLRELLIALNLLKTDEIACLEGVSLTQFSNSSSDKQELFTKLCMNGAFKIANQLIPNLIENFEKIDPIKAIEQNRPDVLAYYSLVKHKHFGYYFPSLIERACAAGHLDVVRFLANDLRVDLLSWNNGPLIEAVQNGHLPVVNFLLANSKVSLRDNPKAISLASQLNNSAKAKSIVNALLTCRGGIYAYQMLNSIDISYSGQFEQGLTDQQHWPYYSREYEKVQSQDHLGSDHCERIANLDLLHISRWKPLEQAIAAICKTQDVFCERLYKDIHAEIDKYNLETDEYLYFSEKLLSLLDLLFCRLTDRGMTPLPEALKDMASLLDLFVLFYQKNERIKLAEQQLIVLNPVYNPQLSKLDPDYHKKIQHPGELLKRFTTEPAYRSSIYRTACLYGERLKPMIDLFNSWNKQAQINDAYSHFDMTAFNLYQQKPNASALDNYLLKNANFQNNMSHLIKYMLIHKLNYDALIKYAIKNKNYPLITLCLRSPQQEQEYYRYENALTYAFQQPSVDSQLICTMLDEMKKKKSCLIDSNREEHLAMQHAAENGLLHILDALIERGINPAAYCHFPLYKAVENGHEAVVKRLLSCIEIRPGAGNNLALRKAASNNHCSVAKLLLQHPEVNPEAEKHDAIISAAKNGCWDMVFLIATHRSWLFANKMVTVLKDARDEAKNAAELAQKWQESNKFMENSYEWIQAGDNFNRFTRESNAIDGCVKKLAKHNKNPCPSFYCSPNPVIEMDVDHKNWEAVYAQIKQLLDELGSFATSAQVTLQKLKSSYDTVNMNKDAPPFYPSDFFENLELLWFTLKNHLKIPEACLEKCAHFLDSRIAMEFNGSFSLEFDQQLVNINHCAKAFEQACLNGFFPIARRISPTKYQFMRDKENLIAAAASGFMPAVALQLSQKKNHDQIFEIACKNERMSVIRLLLLKGQLSLDVFSKAVASALEHNNTELVLLLFSHPLMDHFESGGSLIKVFQCAAQFGPALFFRKLIEKYNANDPLVKKYISTDLLVEAYEVACEYGQTEIVDCLLSVLAANKELGPETGTARNKSIALERAVENGHKPIVKLLLEKGQVTPTAYDNRCIVLAAKTEDFSLVSLLLEYNGGIIPETYSYKHPDTPMVTEKHPVLEPMVRCNQFSLLKNLVTKEYVTLSALEECALPIAAECGHIEIIHWLFQFKHLDLHSKQQEFGKSDQLNESDPLVRSVRAGHLDLVRFLLKIEGENKNTDRMEKLATLALKNNHLDILDCLLPHCKEMPIISHYWLKIYAKTGRFDKLKDRLAQPYALELLSQSNGILEAASEAGHHDIVDWLLKHKTFHKDIDAALECALKNDNLAMAQKLLPLSQKTNFTKLAHILIKNGSLDIFDYFIKQKKISLDFANEYLLVQACKENQADMLTCLLQEEHICASLNAGFFKKVNFKTIDAATEIALLRDKHFSDNDLDILSKSLATEMAVLQEKRKMYNPYDKSSDFNKARGERRRVFDLEIREILAHLRALSEACRILEIVRYERQNPALMQELEDKKTAEFLLSLQKAKREWKHPQPVEEPQAPLSAQTPQILAVQIPQIPAQNLLSKQQDKVEKKNPEVGDLKKFGIYGQKDKTIQYKKPVKHLKQVKTEEKTIRPSSLVSNKSFTFQRDSITQSQKKLYCVAINPLDSFKFVWENLKEKENGGESNRNNYLLYKKKDELQIHGGHYRGQGFKVTIKQEKEENAVVYRAYFSGSDEQFDPEVMALALEETDNTIMYFNEKLKKSQEHKLVPRYSWMLEKTPANNQNKRQNQSINQAENQTDYSPK